MTEERAEYGYQPDPVEYQNILITGGTGYFARAFINQTLGVPWIERMCIYSRNEAAQAQAKRHYDAAGPVSEKMRYLIGDVRDEDRLRRAMDGADLVIHAAALKRIEVAEYNILEAVATNVHGTENVVRAAIDAGVQRVILLSTDKACNPTTTYGLTKALAENIVLKGCHMAGYAPRRPWKHQTTFAVVRYGNVMGSTGSVIPTWQAQREAGHKTVPISHPDATRFWMSAEDAIALVTTAMMQALMPGPGAMFIPTTMKAFRLGDLAKAMDLETTITGLANGEKQHEEILIGRSSEHADRLSVEELRQRLAQL